MRLSDVSIKNPVFAWMLMAALIIFGAISFSRMGVSQLPDVDFPVVNVSLTLAGAAPEVMETTVVDILENALMTVEGVRDISSNSKTGSANITLEFELDRNIEAAVQDVNTKIQQSLRLLPADLDPPTISKTNPDDQPIMWLALTYEKDDPVFLMSYARDYLREKFTTVPGVGDIFLGGYTDPALRVWVQPEALPRFNISVNDIIDAIQTEHSELPGGYIETEKRNFNVRTLGEAKTVEDFKKIVISKRAGQSIADPSQMVRIGQVARVEEGLDEIQRISRFNQKPALGLGIRKQRGSNAVAVAKAVREQMAIIQPQLPPGMQIQLNFDSTRFIEASIKELNKHLVLAVILTSLVCWMFLGSWSATFNVLLSIPTSIMGAFIGLYFLGYTLNTFTLLGLTLSIGIVVDDAIMVLENIFRYKEKGKGSIDAAIIGAREIAFAALAATAAVVAIFLPVVFMKGVIGKFFMQFGVTISFAVLLSLLEALTITPMRCATFVKMGERSTKLGKAFDSGMELLRVSYESWLRWTLANRMKVFVGSLVFVVISFFTVKFIDKEMAPAQDQSMFLIRASLPVGSSLAYTNEQTKKAEEWLLGRGEVRGVYAAIGGFGGGGSGGSGTNVTMMFVTLKPFSERPKDPDSGKRNTQQAFMEVVRKELSKIPDLKPVIQDLSMRGFSSGRGFPVEFTVLGPNWEKLSSQTTAFMKAMEESGLMVDVDSNYLLGMPEISIVPDRVQAALHGVSVAAIGKTVNALIGGVKVGQYSKDGHRSDIKVMLEKQKDPMTALNDLSVGNTRSNLIPLTRLTKQEDRKVLQSISRVSRQRAISVYANLKKGVSQQAALAKVQEIAKQTLEPGYMIDASGSSKAFKESMGGLMFALIMGFVVAYMVLASQFNSFLDPVSILMALPFSFSGAFFALLISQQSINMYSMIGILLLMGIVKKNSILLIEFTNLLRERKNSDANTALIEACPIRLRPILMTSFATIAAAIPSATAFGEGSETMRPMAITIIGGVLVSTILTLFVVPCVYSMLDRFRSRDRSNENIRQAFDRVGSEGIEAHS